MRSLIAIPTYQRAHHITRAVEAALTQSQDDVMVAVIDDGSTDPTEEACRRWFEHPRFVYVRAGRNLGTAAAKNLALALVPFDAITFHDSDDIPSRDRYCGSNACWRDRIWARTPSAMDANRRGAGAGGRCRDRYRSQRA